MRHATTPEYESYSLVNSMNPSNLTSDRYQNDQSGEKNPYILEMNVSDAEIRCLCCLLDESVAYNDSMQVEIVYSAMTS